MNNCLLCCDPIVRKCSKSVETSVWETVLKVLRTTQSEPLGDVSGFEKCQLCEICLNFTSRCCEIIRVITELQLELHELNGKLRSSFEKSVYLEKQAEENCTDVESTLWVEARRSLKACIGIGDAATEQIIEVCPVWEESIVLSPRTQLGVGDGGQKSTDEDELLHEDLDRVEETRKATQFRTFTVQGFVLKDLEIRVERLTEDFISKAIRRNSQPLIAVSVSDAESSGEDSDSDYSYASDQSANNSCGDENSDSGRIANEKGRYRNKFLKGDELQRHEKCHSEGKQCRKPWCEICKLNFSSTKSLYEHRKSVHKDSRQYGQFVCDKCGKAYTNVTHFNKHQRLHEDGKLCCDLCNMSFPGPKNLKIHKRRVHPGGALSKTGPLECKTCSDSFDTRAALLDHTKTCSRSHGPDGSVTCQLCAKIFTNRTQLLKHMIYHRPARHVCEVCGKRFVEPHLLRRHLATHTEEKLYTCEMCGKHVVDLKPHLRICQEKRANEDEKTFKCSQCDKSFLLQESLRTHERFNHRDRTTETPFQCDVCHQYFKMKCFLVEHRRRAHFPEERLPCTMCSATFILPKDLNWHMQYDHFGKRDKCIICGYEGKSRTAFRLHMLMHRVGRRYECEVCGKKFMKSDHLSRHKKIHEKQ